MVFTDLLLDALYSCYGIVKNKMGNQLKSQSKMLCSGPINRCSSKMRYYLHNGINIFYLEPQPQRKLSFDPDVEILNMSSSSVTEDLSAEKVEHHKKNEVIISSSSSSSDSSSPKVDTARRVSPVKVEPFPASATLPPIAGPRNLPSLPPINFNKALAKTPNTIEVDHLLNNDELSQSPLQSPNLSSDRSPRSENVPVPMQRKTSPQTPIVAGPVDVFDSRQPDRDLESDVQSSETRKQPASSYSDAEKDVRDAGRRKGSSLGSSNISELSLPSSTSSEPAPLLNLDLLAPKRDHPSTSTVASER